MQFLTVLKKRDFIYRLVLTLLFLLGAIVIHSCKKENNKQKAENTDVENLRTWYNTSYPVSQSTNGLITQSVDGNKFKIDFSRLLKPDWGHAASYTRLNKNVTELPIDLSSKFATALQNSSLNKTIYKKEYSKSSFLFFHDGANYEAYIMIIIADSSYLKNDLSKISHNSYYKRDADFGGMVLYFTPKGDFVSGWLYKNGVLVLPSNTPNTSSQQLRSIGSSKLKTMSEQAICYDYWLVSYTNGEEDSREYLFTDCESSGNGSTGSAPGGSQGGGATSGPTNSPEQPCTPMHPIVNSDGKLTINSAPAVPPSNPPGSPPDPHGGGFPPPTNGTQPCTVSTVITNSVTNQCLHNLVDITITSGVSTQINSLINSVFGGDATPTLTFLDVSNLASTRDAQTASGFASDGSLVTADIELNVNVLPNASKEYIAATIMHETLHAYYASINGGNSELDHEAMAIDYVNKMATSLVQMFPTMSPDDAKALAYGGLEETSTYHWNVADFNLASTYQSINASYRNASKGHGCNN